MNNWLSAPVNVKSLFRLAPWVCLCAVVQYTFIGLHTVLWLDEGYRWDRVEKETFSERHPSVLSFTHVVSDWISDTGMSSSSANRYTWHTCIALWLDDGSGYMCTYSVINQAVYTMIGWLSSCTMNDWPGCTMIEWLTRLYCDWMIDYLYYGWMIWQVLVWLDWLDDWPGYTVIGWLTRLYCDWMIDQAVLWLDDWPGCTVIG